MPLPFGKAGKLFSDFHGRAPEIGEIVRIRYPEDKALLVGTLDMVAYTSVGDGRTYVHRFARGVDSRPRLLVSGDGCQIYVVAGQYKFTNRGFIG